MSSHITFPVGQGGAFLATRGKARSLRESLEKRVAADAARGRVEIDFSGVEAMTISFADEFLGRFFTALAAGDVRPVAVLLTGLNEENTEAVTVCLERRDLAAVTSEGTQKHLVGAQDFLVDSYQRALELQHFKASEFAESLGITPQNANNRLKRLVAAGAVQKERATTAGRGGKEFSYALPCWGAD
jgi:predicted transcriptional regulator